jgi:hypothetical protein
VCVCLCACVAIVLFLVLVFRCCQFNDSDGIALGSKDVGGLIVLIFFACLVCSVHPLSLSVHGSAQ